MKELPEAYRMYTYQDLMAEAQVSFSTVWRWFRDKRKFKVNNTVRILQPEAIRFIKEYTQDEKITN